ncbi:MAG: amidohydrolase [Candidatus Sulfotelmatobacter sp.]
MRNRIMNSASIKACIAVFALVLSSFSADSPQTAPDLILFNGKIFTSDSAHPYVQALAIRGDRIVATGDSDKIKALAGLQTKQIDLGGRTVIPGINDAHNHLSISPPNRIHLEFTSPDPVWPEVKSAIAAAVTKASKGTIIYGDIGGGIFHDIEVNRDSLDTVAPDLPVILETFTGHAWILNSAALAKAGIREDQPDLVGGRYERSPDGRLTGVLREYAVLQADRRLADQTSEADALAELRETFASATKWGITTIQDMSNSMAPDRCVTLLEKMPVSIRVRVMRMPGTTAAGRNITEGRPAPRSSNPLITVSGTKWLLDGVPLEGTFAARSDSSTVDYLFLHQQLTFTKTELAAMLRESLKDHDQLLVHVSAYPAAAEMLTAMQSAGGARVWADRRVRFEHGDGLTPDLIPQAKTMGVVVVQNPAHLAAVQMIPDLKGRMEKIHAQPLGSLLAAGIPLALGSDGPMNPYLNIMLASLHPDRPSEAITREQAVIAYTLTSAYAEFAEKEKGSLEAGKLADLAVLSQDIFTVTPPELPKTASVLTIVGGKVVYDAGAIRSQDSH